MSKLYASCIAAFVCGGCAKPSTMVLEPYALADGTMFQDVVTIAADERGTAPVVTHTKTFELRTGFKGGCYKPYGGDGMTRRTGKSKHAIGRHRGRRARGYRHPCPPTRPVATASGNAPGFISTIGGAAVSAAIPAAAGMIIAKQGWARTTVNNSVDNDNSSNSHANNSNRNVSNSSLSQINTQNATLNNSNTNNANNTNNNVNNNTNTNIN